MSQSLIKILVHVVFSTKDRMDLIPLEMENELYKYIHGRIGNNSARLIIAGGTANHIHLLISIGKTDVPTLIGDIKRSTSHWMKKKGRKVLLAKRLRRILDRAIAGSGRVTIHPRPKRTSRETRLQS